MVESTTNTELLVFVACSRSQDSLIMPQQLQKPWRVQVAELHHKVVAWLAPLICGLGQGGYLEPNNREVLQTPSGASAPWSKRPVV